MTRTEEINKIRILLLIVFCVISVSGFGKKSDRLHFMLWWTRPNRYLLREGQAAFIEANCKYQNCYVYNNFPRPVDLSQFSVLMFDSVELFINKRLPLPTQRYDNQKFVFFGTEPASRWPINPYYNNVFNWTFTYKLDSDIVSPNIVVRGQDSTIIGPKKDMHWISVNNMAPLSREVVLKLEQKTKAVVWFVRGCEELTPHKKYVLTFKSELARYNHTVDVLGFCPQSGIDIQFCSEEDPNSSCTQLIRSKYRFYLSFETDMSEDYVTKQLLIALKHYAVPIVFGGANYSRFMPDGIFLDAFELAPDELAGTISNLMNDHLPYYDMFKWHKYYIFNDPRETSDSNALCQLCELVNNKKSLLNITMQPNIVTWFNERKDWNIDPYPEYSYEVTRWLTNL